LEYELRKAGLQVECQKPISVYYDGMIVGDFLADSVVEGKVIIELKANQALVSANEAQLVNYLTATRLEVGLPINFGAQRLEFKRKTRTYRPTKSRQENMML
jgi:GxxExxY protein